MLIFGIVVLLIGIAVVSYIEHHCFDTDPWTDLERSMPWLAWGMCMVLAGFGTSIYAALHP